MIPLSIGISSAQPNTRHQTQERRCDKLPSELPEPTGSVTNHQDHIFLVFVVPVQVADSDQINHSCELNEY